MQGPAHTQMLMELTCMLLKQLFFSILCSLRKKPGRTPRPQDKSVVLLSFIGTTSSTASTDLAHMNWVKILKRPRTDRCTCPFQNCKAYMFPWICAITRDTGMIPIPVHMPAGITTEPSTGDNSPLCSSPIFFLIHTSNQSRLDCLTCYHTLHPEHLPGDLPQAFQEVSLNQGRRWMAPMRDKQSS